MQSENVLVFLLQCIIAAGGAVVAVRAVRYFLAVPGGVVRRAIPYLLFATTMLNKSWIGDENPLYLFPFFIAGFLICYKGPWYARLVTGVAFYCLLEPLCMMVDSVELYAPYVLPYEIGTSLLKLAGWAILWLIIRRLAPGPGGIQLSRRLWGLIGLLSLAPLFSILSFGLWRPSRFDYDTFMAVSRGIAYPILPFTMLSALALLAAIVVMARHQQQEEARRLSEVQAAYYQSLLQEQTQLRTLKHDLHNHIAAAQSLLQQGKAAEAEEYLKQLSRLPVLAASVRVCDNDVANAVLLGKAALMQHRGIEADWEVALPQSLPVPDVELCALLGNALDNAIEAVADAPEKRILLRARADKGVLMLRVRNPVGKPLQQQNGRFKTTKADAQAHGYGLPGMREIVQRHGGSLEAVAQDGAFELLVYLPLGWPCLYAALQPKR